MIARQLLLVAVLALAPDASGLARDLTIAVPDMLSADIVRDIYVQPFASATGIATRLDVREAGLESMRVRKDSAPLPWDVALLSADELLAACDEGLLEKLDWPAIGGKDHYQPIGVSECGVGSTFNSIALAWDRDKFPVTPTWADFWDIAKYPGKRGLRKSAATNLEFALMADGVAPSDIYRTLKSSDGVDRAFRKLDQLRPYIVWWESDDQAAKFLGSGEVLMTSAPAARALLAGRAEHHNFGIQWAGSIFSVASWSVIKSSPNARQAYQFLYFAGSSAIQAHLLSIAPYPGLARGANDGLAPELLAQTPVGAGNQASGVQSDEQFWRDNGDKLGQRFAAWLSR